MLITGPRRKAPSADAMKSRAAANRVIKIPWRRVGSRAAARERARARRSLVSLAVFLLRCFFRCTLRSHERRCAQPLAASRPAAHFSIQTAESIGSSCMATEASSLVMGACKALQTPSAHLLQTHHSSQLPALGFRASHSRFSGLGSLWLSRATVRLRPVRCPRKSRSCLLSLLG